MIRLDRKPRNQKSIMNILLIRLKLEHFNLFQFVPLFLLILLILPKSVLSYECYVCENQDDNNEKCIKTVKTCNLEDNSCMTVVRWGSTPYWDPTGQKQYYISKRCATFALCNEAKENISHRCDRIWYNDWECVECCTGDRCNYYITLGVSAISANMIITTMIITMVIIYQALIPKL